MPSYGARTKARPWAACRLSGFAIYTKVDRWLDSLRSDPRYGEMLKKMNLE